jgi:iron complex outermembrane recepter protein
MRTSLIAAIVASVVGFSAGIEAQAAIRRATAIPPQDLAPALRTLVQEREFQIVYSSELLQDRHTRGAAGDLTMGEALTQLLSGTGLTYQYLDDQTVAIVPAGTRAQDDQNETASEESQAANGRGPKSDEVRKRSFWDRFRLAQGDRGASVSAVASAEADSGSPESVRLEEIVVTAQKRVERLIDTPQSMSVLSAETLAKGGALQFRDYADTIPGLGFTTAGAGRTQVSLRGVTTGLDVSPTVGIYVDDVPFGSSSAFAQGSNLALDVGLFDLDRIEVLRGPQGTLYGASTVGGLIKYVTRRPDVASLGGDAQAGVSSTERGGINYNIAAAVNLPIMPNKIALRATGFESRDGGYTHNVALGRDEVNRSDIYGGRLDLLLTPNDALEVRVSAFLQNISRDGDATMDYSLAGPPLFGNLDQVRPSEEPFEQRFRLVSGTVTYDFGPTVLTSISSYQTTHTEIGLDVSGFYGPILQTVLERTYSSVGIPQELETDKITQEVRLASGSGVRLEWILGAFYTNEDSQWVEEFALSDAAGQPAPNDLYMASFPSTFEEYAGFGDLTYHVTQRFDVSAGLRYAHNEQEFTQIGSGLIIGSIPANRSSDDVFTYLANARYRFGDRATGYLRYATGYRPGGPNFLLKDPSTGFPLAPPTFDSDELKSYEAGFKAETSDRRLGLDFAVYDIDWTDIQVVSFRGGVGFRVNAPGGARVRGTELTLTARPADGLSISGAFAYQDAELSEADADLGASEGERLPNVPRFTAAATIDYELPIATVRPRLGATARYVSDRTASFDQSVGFPQYRLPDYTTIDVRAGVVLDSFDLQLYVRNLFDERGQLSGYTPYGTARTAILQPRTIGLSVTKQF